MGARPSHAPWPDRGLPCRTRPARGRRRRPDDDDHDPDGRVLLSICRRECCVLGRLQHVLGFCVGTHRSIPVQSEPGATPIWHLSAALGGFLHRAATRAESWYRIVEQDIRAVLPDHDAAADRLRPTTRECRRAPPPVSKARFLATRAREHLCRPRRRPGGRHGWPVHRPDRSEASSCSHC